MVTVKLEYETGLSDSESAIRFAIKSVGTLLIQTGFVNVVNGSVGTVASQHRGGPAIVTSRNERYLVDVT